MKFITLIFLLCQIALFGSTDFSIFEAYQDRLSRSQLESRLFCYLQKRDQASPFFTLTDEVFILYNAPESALDREIEFKLRLSKKPAKNKPSLPRKDLVGVRVAIDPGHFGGPYARLEERYIALPPSLERKEAIAFDEGTLAFLTAVYLKLLLEKDGAIVMITRDQIGKGVYEKDFFEWLKATPSLWSGEVSLNKLFRSYFNPLDLRARAKKINAFNPDLSIVIHYNSHHVKEEKSSNSSLAPENYNLVFIPGAFCRGELSEKDNRFDFLRLLLTDDLVSSALLSKAVLKEFSRHLDVPVVSQSDGASYLENVCLKVDEGVYARNLALTRMIHSPVCYGETLIQNNIDECINLNRKDFVIDGIQCSSRIKQVAEAYYDGIRTYLLDTMPK